VFDPRCASVTITDCFSSFFTQALVKPNIASSRPAVLPANCAERMVSTAQNGARGDVHVRPGLHARLSPAGRLLPGIILRIAITFSDPAG